MYTQLSLQLDSNTYVLDNKQLPNESRDTCSKKETVVMCYPLFTTKIPSHYSLVNLNCFILVDMIQFLLKSC